MPIGKKPLWPLAAMGVLIGLLATFVGVVLARRNDGGVTPTATPLAVVVPSKTPTPTASPTAAPTGAPTPVPSAPDSREAAAAKILGQAREALKTGNLGDAAQLVQEARRTKDSPAAQALEEEIVEALKQRARADEIARKEREERERREREAAALKEKEEREKREREERERREREAAAQAAELEQRKKAEEAFAALRPELERLDRESRYETEVRLLEKTEKEHPVLAKVAEFTTLKAKLSGLAEESRKVAAADFAKARTELAARRYLSATKLVLRGRQYHPESPEADPLLKQIAEAMLGDGLVEVPAATSVKLGNPADGEEGARRYSTPGFLMDRTEVTNEQYAMFVRATGHKPPANRFWAAGEPVRGAETLPVTGVTVEDAEAFAKWAGKRLPTEDEWEYAARGVDGRTYPWGTAWPPGDQAAPAYTLEASRELKFEPKPVGTFPGGASPFGILDMAGGVWEWTATSDEKGLRVMRGGSYISPKETARTWHRHSNDPGLGHPDVGFRCVRDLKGK